MNEYHICKTRNQKPLPIRIPQMPFDEKLAYVESVCLVLNESRFGSGYSYSFLDWQDNCAADEQADPLAVIDDGYLPWYATAYRGRAPQRQAQRRAALERASAGRKFTIPVSDAMSFLVTARDQFPPTLGRGSP